MFVWSDLPQAQRCSESPDLSEVPDSKYLQGKNRVVFHGRLMSPPSPRPMIGEWEVGRRRNWEAIVKLSPRRRSFCVSSWQPDNTHFWGWIGDAHDPSPIVFVRSHEVQDTFQDFCPPQKFFSPYPRKSSLQWLITGYLGTQEMSIPFSLTDLPVIPGKNLKGPDILSPLLFSLSSSSFSSSSASPSPLQQ